MKHQWSLLGGSYRARQHRCKTCGLRKHTLIPTEGFPVSTYQLKDGSEVKGKAPKCHDPDRWKYTNADMMASLDDIAKTGFRGSKP